MIVELGELTMYSEQAQLTETVKFKLTDLVNWYSSPPVEVDVVSTPGRDGAFNPVRSYRGAKSMSLEGVCYARDTQTAIRDAWKKIAGIASSGQSLELAVEDEDGRLTQQVWLNGGPQVVPFGPRKARFAIPLVATDPRKYGAMQSLQTGASGDSGDGMVWPLFATGYLDFGVFSPTGLIYLENEGEAESWPLFVVRGELIGGFQIISGSDVIQYDADVASGTEVTLSPYAGGRATIGGVDVTTNLSQSDWPVVAAGETRNLVFNALGTASAAARLTATFRPAWW